MRVAIHSLCFALCGLVGIELAVPPPSVQANEPLGVVRTFGFYATGSSVGPSFVGEDSVGVVVLRDNPESESGLLVFSLFEDVPEELAGTLWVSQTARHLTKDHESPGGAFFWLLTEEAPTPPPAGALAFTGGPNSSLLSSFDYYIALCNSDCCSGDDNLRWRVVNTGGTPFVIVTAVFTK